MVYSYHTRLLRFKKKTADTYNRIDEPQKHYAEQKKKKKATKEYILYDCHLYEIRKQAKLIYLDRKQISD